jgi:hypothetical protein
VDNPEVAKATYQAMFIVIFAMMEKFDIDVVALDENELFEFNDRKEPLNVH